MVILRLLRRSFSCASCVTRTKFLGDTLHKKLFVQKLDPGFFSNKRLFNSYEGDGRTVGFIINKKNAEVLLISEVMNYGFVLASGSELVGSLILFPHSIMSWNVLSAKEISEESLTLFKIMDPKVDILVLGYGSPRDYTPEIRDKFQKICKKLGLRYEALPTEQAAGVYNFLADERRLVAAALIPPTDFSPFRYPESSDSNLLDDEELELETIADEELNKKKLIH